MEQRMTLRDARKRAKCSKVALAQRTGLHRLTIARMEGGETNPLHQSVRVLERELSKLLGSTVSLHFPRQPRVSR